jgi:hypothetical protein
MTVVWIPITIAMIIKILFQKERNLSWDRTEHTGEIGIAMT